MFGQFVLGDRQFFNENCEYCEWLYSCLLRLIRIGENTRLFDEFYLWHVYGRGLVVDVRGRQGEEEVEGVEPL